MPSTAAIDLGALKILIIDDQEFVRTIVKKMLQQVGVGLIVEAHDGNSGLEAAERDLPDVVICDVQMRPVDGFGFVKALRAKPFGTAMPVIMLTAHTDATTVERAKELNVNAFLAKPVLPPALKEKIIAVVGKGKTG
ncbi:chemotaxis protein [Paramagnetospirillum marisnigri]|uniref:Chemotaxis protein n=1 Tax=Paramagnetospirillum marisnigri TaxID=1285242 RepID=A0A178MAW6_9PROT|nr:response regulator [Paramagnetospirillum marisnigri]OAN45676.1 chemotaxis protein [Paramagnetospirillum marisnigri]OAN45698.1 chemotaxis protein [Paramagnetospirillum marisnigri]